MWDGYCADPFVLRTRDGRYVMYGTTPSPLPEGRAFQVLVSDDLDHWDDVGGALVVGGDDPPGTEYWAPEVAFADDRYWMYYSSGIGDQGHRLRVATATDATGPFEDLGVVLTPDVPFAIDPSPYLDGDGSWWLFYATDLVEGDRPGTVLAVQRLSDMTRLEGEPTIILRASAEWQRYEADREMYGGVHDWHTLEGPTVMDDGAGGCLLLYSGGNWQTPGYGVAVATAPAPQGPWHEDPDRGPVVTSAGTGLIGPGHCSVLTDGDGTRHVFLHAWDPTLERRRPHRLRLHVHEGHVSVGHPDAPPEQDSTGEGNSHG
ncbi:glycoside hydrolase family 43 protein [Knoellia aerolata]|uniref:Glycoside hydrolase n=1 Tax=Knoellia aerolata DSM 18566 TaxID=1385519 RepID=A0A0A0JYP8_9MICO|nr:glycoside hydrolase family 43 protein [Knoellia aerolata]KGN41212.1 glycoside hydrolase [Knoellia aerolata DSM 18566]